MYVEDLVVIIQEQQHQLTLNDWQRRFVANVATQLSAARQLSTKQVDVIVGLGHKLRSSLLSRNLVSPDAIANLLTTQECRTQPYESNSVRREVRYLGDNLLAFRFKADAFRRERIKSFGTVDTTRWLGEQPVIPHRKPWFDWLYKLWIVPVYSFNLMAICEFIEQQRCHLDQPARDYLTLARRSFHQPSLFAIDPATQVILTNVCDHPILAAWITEVAGGIPL